MQAHARRHGNLLVSSVSVQTMIWQRPCFAIDLRTTKKQTFSIISCDKLYNIPFIHANQIIRDIKPIEFIEQLINQVKLHESHIKTTANAKVVANCDSQLVFYSNFFVVAIKMMFYPPFGSNRLKSGILLARFFTIKHNKTWWLSHEKNIDLMVSVTIIWQ